MKPNVTDQFNSDESEEEDISYGMTHATILLFAVQSDGFIRVVPCGGRFKDSNEGEEKHMRAHACTHARTPVRTSRQMQYYSHNCKATHIMCII